MWLTHFSPLKVERSQNIGLMTKKLCLIIIHFNIWKMIGQGRSLFEHSLHLKRESSWVHVSNSEKNMKTKTKGAHLWALCGGWAIRPFQHRGSAPFVTRPAVGTYGTLNVSSLPSPPPLGDHMAMPLRSKRRSCIPNESHVNWYIMIAQNLWTWE